MATAVRFAPGSAYRFVAAQARDQVYDLTPNKGRATLTEIVARTGAAGGVNGDFFQWGNDPGGDPVNLMVRNGELLSAPAPASPGGRGLAWGWAAGRVRLRATGLEGERQPRRRDRRAERLHARQGGWDSRPPARATRLARGPRRSWCAGRRPEGLDAPLRS